jgi:hypothetical protein
MKKETHTIDSNQLTLRVFKSRIQGGLHHERWELTITNSYGAQLLHSTLDAGLADYLEGLTGRSPEEILLLYGRSELPRLNRPPRAV